MSPWKVILATIVIFAAGVITGGVLVNRLQRPPRVGPMPPGGGFARPPQQDFVPTPWFARREFLDRMDRELNLSRDQYDRIAAIMKQSQERTHKRIGPQVQEELRQVRREIRAELTPEQAKRFEEFQHQFRRPPRPPNESTDMRRGPPPLRHDQPPLNARPETNTP